MPLEQHPMTASDLPIFSSIMNAAFRDGLGAIMYPHGMPAAAAEQSLASNRKALTEHGDRVKFFRIVDTSLPADAPHSGTVAVAEWKLFPHDRSEAELDADDAEASKDGLPVGMDPSFAAAFFGQLGEYKRKNLGGRAYILLHILAVSPEHHRKGAGRKALQWGLEEADRRDLPCYLESSPMGKGLYEKEGFEVLNWLPFDGREFGGKEELRHACMLRKRKSERQ